MWYYKFWLMRFRFRMVLSCAYHSTPAHIISKLAVLRGPHLGLLMELYMAPDVHWLCLQAAVSKKRKGSSQGDQEGSAVDSTCILSPAANGTGSKCSKKDSKKSSKKAADSKRDEHIAMLLKASAKKLKKKGSLTFKKLRKLIEKSGDPCSDDILEQLKARLVETGAAKCESKKLVHVE